MRTPVKNGGLFVFMELKLTKPIVFFDIESTGLNPVTDRIIEISMLKIHPDGREDEKTFLLNPTIPIPEESSAVHGILDKDVEKQPTFKEVAAQVQAFIKGCDLGGYNSNRFDIPMLAEEFERSGVDIDIKKFRLIDVQVIFFKQEPRTLAGAYRFYCDKELENAHSARADVRATWEILNAQLERYDELENNIESLSELSSSDNFADLAGRLIFDDKGDILFNFGKHKGKRVDNVFRREPSYYDWMMQGDFPAYTKKLITRVYLDLKKNI
jgi:DNA polymerase-3 subunit epsilon